VEGYNIGVRGYATRFRFEIGCAPKLRNTRVFGLKMAAVTEG
jgi:hypothetical protein